MLSLSMVKMMTMNIANVLPLSQLILRFVSRTYCGNFLQSVGGGHFDFVMGQVMTDDDCTAEGHWNMIGLCGDH